MAQHISSARSEAARRNGAKSRGPKTGEGKLRSSQNSTKHGMYARSVVLPGESQEDYDQLRDQYLAEFTPTGPTENHQVETMINAEWRIRRFRYMETALIANEMLDHHNCEQDLQVAYSYGPEMKGTGTCIKSIYQFEPRLQRDYDRALRRLLDLQKQRKNEPKPASGSELTTDHCPLTTANHQPLTTSSELPTDNQQLTTNSTVVFHPTPPSHHEEGEPSPTEPDIHLLNPSKPSPDPLA